MVEDGAWGWKNTPRMPLLPMLSALWLGLLAGGQHALTGPDHFAGVAPFAASRGKCAWRVGLV
jgi:hypothetical protein